jgi:hypothetical protein
MHRQDDKKHKRKKKGLLTKVERDGIFCNSDQWQVVKVDSAKTLWTNWQKMQQVLLLISSYCSIILA